MNSMAAGTSLLLPLITLALGAVAGFLVLRLKKAAEIAALEERLHAREATIGELKTRSEQQDGAVEKLRHENSSLLEQRSELSEKLRNAAEERAFLEQLQRQFTDAFKALSSDALKSNNQAFLELARSTLGQFQEGARGELEKRQTAIDQLVKPLRESLDKFDVKIQEIEKARVGAYEGLSQQVRSLVDLQSQLKAETGNLVKALGTPRVRGRWGEIQLRRVVELAGMMDHCDFSEQTSVQTDEGARLRPDLIVHLPAGKKLVVDSKVPLAGYLEALEATDEKVRKAKLCDHSRQLREHALALGRKAYWEQFSPAPEFVILFVPGEAFFSAALEHDPELIEQAVAERVLFATPTTLIALLKAVAYGWRQERLAQNAADISALGKDLYKRLADLAGNFAGVGLNLGRAVESYNKALYNLESRVLVTARKFRELDAAATEKELAEPKLIDEQPRTIQAPELLPEKFISEN